METPGFFWANDPNVNQQLRQRIALSMLSQKKAYPKTFGEGLSAIGDAIGDIGITRRLEQGDLAQQQAAKASVDSVIGGGQSPALPGKVSAAEPGEVSQQPQATASVEPVSDGGYNTLDARAGIDQNVSSWYDFARKGTDQGGLGLNHEQASGLVGNLQQESTPGIKPSGVVGDGGTAFGAAQWRNDRFANLQKFATDRGLDWQNEQTQQQFMRHELMGQGGTGGGSESPAYSRLSAAQTPQAAATAFNRGYERSADVSGRREANAGRVAQMFSGAAQGDPRDSAAAILAARSPPGAPLAYAPSNDVASDAPPVTGLAPQAATRDSIAQLVAPPQGQTVPGAIPPTSAAFTPAATPEPQPDPRLAQAPSPVATDAPPAAPPVIQKAPDPGYVMPEPQKPQLPGLSSYSPLERKGMAEVANNPNNPYIAQRWAPILAEEKAKRDYLDQRNNKQFEADVALNREKVMKREEQVATRAQRVQTYAKVNQEIQQQAITPPPPPVTGTDPRLGTPQSPQRTGVPTAPPVPPGITPKEHAAQYAPILTKAVEAEEKAKGDFRSSLDIVNQLRNHPGREYGLGAIGKVARETPGTDAFAFDQLLNQAKGKQFLQAYASLKGGGSITQIEGEKATQALARLNAAQSPKEFDKALNDLDKTLREDMETAQRKVNRPVTAWRGWNDKTSLAPDIGQRRGSLRYNGGNPSDPMSWSKAE